MSRCLAVVTLALALAAPASATTRTGQADDPADAPPSLSEQRPDIQHAAVAYDDTTGTIQVAITFYASVRESGVHVEAALGTGSGPKDRLTCNPSVVGMGGWGGGASLPPTATMIPDLPPMPEPAPAGSLLIIGTDGQTAMSGSFSEDGRTITLTASHPLLASRPLTCAFVSESSYSNPCSPYSCVSRTLIDEVPAFYFDGYAPLPVRQQVYRTAFDVCSASPTSKLAYDLGVPNKPGRIARAFARDYRRPLRPIAVRGCLDGIRAYVKQHGG